MPKFSIEYVVEATDLNVAAQIAHENVYFAEIEVDSVKVRPLRVPLPTTFDEVPTETSGPIARKILGDASFGDVI